MATQFNNTGKTPNQPIQPPGPTATNPKQPRTQATINPVQQRQTPDAITQPFAPGQGVPPPGQGPPDAAPSHTKPSANGFLQQPGQAPPGQQAAAPDPNADGQTTLQGQTFSGPNGEKITMKPGPNGEMTMDPMGQDDQDATLQPPPTSIPSPLGTNSPIEQSLAKPGQGGRPGANYHMRLLTKDSMSTLNPEQQKAHEEAIVRDFEQFGDYEGADDPNSPPPPIRAGKYNFNPASGKWTQPDGTISILDKMGPK